MTIQELANRLEHYKAQGYGNSIVAFRFYRDEEEYERVTSSVRLEFKEDGKDYLIIL